MWYDKIQSAKSQIMQCWEKYFGLQMFELYDRSWQDCNRYRDSTQEWLVR